MEDTNFFQRRKQDLEKALNAAADLLSHYQEELLLTSDPRDRMRYEHNIQEVKGNIEQLRCELTDVLSRLGGSSAAETSTLPQLYSRLDHLDRQVAEISELLKYYPEERQKKLTFEIVQVLDDQQFQEVREVLEAYQAGRLAEDDAQSLVLAVNSAVALEAVGGQAQRPNQDLVVETQQVVSQADLPFSSKIKVSIPIVPLVASWDLEVGVDGKIDLKTLWNRILAKVRGQK